jgi:hypothetical protein
MRPNKYINKYRILQGTVSYILFSWTWKHMYCQRRHLVLQLIPRLTLASVDCTDSQDASFFRSHIFSFMIRSGHSPFRPIRSRTGVWKLLFADGWCVERNADLQAPTLHLCANNLLTATCRITFFGFSQESLTKWKAYLGTETWKKIFIWAKFQVLSVWNIIVF